MQLKIKINISEGNSKIGKIPNLNLPPVATCGKDLPCYKECYARKSFAQYPNVRTAWEGNLLYFNEHPYKFFSDWDGYLRYKKPDLFRIHSAGDMPDEWYLEALKRLTWDHPHTTFLMFTKRYDYDFTDIPENFKIYLSTWPGLALPANPEGLPLAWIEADDRKPEEYFRCPGNCGDCHHTCWQMDGIAVAFPKH